MKNEIYKLIDEFRSINNKNPRFIYLGRETFLRIVVELGPNEINLYPSIRSQICGLTYFIVNADEHLNVA